MVLIVNCGVIFGIRTQSFTKVNSCRPHPQCLAFYQLLHTLLIAVFRIENIIFPLLYDYPLVAQESGYFDSLVVAELYIVQSVSFLQTFQVVIITADIAIGKSGILARSSFLWTDMVLPVRAGRLRLCGRRKARTRGRGYGLPPPR